MNIRALYNKVLSPLRRRERLGESLLFLALLLLVSSCSNISEDERLIYVKPAAVKRQVLIEDFTGQRCVNCPNANDEIALLQQQYGADNVIAVAIHAGPLAFYTNSRFLGLRTETGDEYYDHWHIEYQPAGMVDRQAVTDYSSWAGRVHEELEKTASVDIVIASDLQGSKLNLTTTISGIDGDTSGKLQLWIVEDDITAFQLMPDGTRNDNYVHQHVFRATVNGLWGEDISVREGESISRSHQMELSADWKVSNLSVIAFVYDQSGVRQVKKNNILINSILYD